MTQITDAEILEKIRTVITLHTGISEDKINLETSFYEDLN